MTKKSKRKRKINKPLGIDTSDIARKTLQGRSFLTFDFFKRNWAYVLALTVMTLMYISNKYTCQDSLQQVMLLTTALDNAKTDCVSASAKYNSMIRESQMVEFIDSMHINLAPPEQPPFKLTENEADQ